MRKILFISLLFFLAPTLVKAQFTETIGSGRPGRSNGPFGVGKKVFQLQSGVTFNTRKIEEDGTDVTSTNRIIDQSSVFRYGLFKTTELRAAYGINLKDQIERKGDLFNFKENNSGLRSFNLGIRQHLIEQKGILPAVGVQLTALLGGTGDYRRPEFYEGKLLLQHRFSDVFFLNTNLIYEYYPEFDNKELDFVFSFSYTVSAKIRLVAELYGTYDKDETNLFPGKTDILFDAGIAYLINKDFALDIFGGYDKTEYGSGDLTRYFVSVGVSYRIHKRD